MPSDLTLKTMNTVHRLLTTVTFGKFGRQFGVMPVLELTTIGRKSGQRRSVLLTSPVQQGDSLVIVASRGGDDHHPAWFLNLQANPDVEVSLKGAPKETRRARILSSDERTALWPQVTAAYKGYAGYQEKTDREIPLVALEPV
jgi:deazaflavin-dependent oxidoreductase (nitroreductase family)